MLGTDASRIMIRSGNCGVVLMDDETGPNTRKKIRDLCLQSEIPLKTVPERTIEDATGKPNVVMAIRKGPFAESVLREYDAQI